MIRIELTCDECGEVYGDLSAVDRDDAERLAEQNGWCCEQGIQFCPKHADIDVDAFLDTPKGAFL